MSQKYRIAIIDEFEDDIDDFFAFFEDDFDIVEIELVDDKPTIIKSIFEKKVDIVAFDYKLMEHDSNVSFDGHELLEMLDEELYDFPAFILTQNVLDASKKTNVDDFRIFSKRWMNKGTDEGQEFLIKVKNRVKKYRQNLQNAENKLLQLINKHEEEGLLNADNVREMKRLDDFLEHSMYLKTKIPSDWKSPDALIELKSFADTAEKILQKLQSKPNE